MGCQAWTERQKRCIKNIPTSKSHAEAAVKAGYPVKNAAQSAHQALQQMRGRAPDLMDQLGISEQELIDKHLRRLLTAERTIFARKDGKFTDKRTVDALETQIRALDLAFLLHGSYAPRDPKEAAQFGVKVIVQDLGLLRGANGRPPIDIKPGMAVPELPTQANERREACGLRPGERLMDKRGHD